jgi:signal transduction histidine kinase
MVVVPLRSQSVDGVLVAARSTTAPRFLPVDGDVAREFASAIAITLELIAANTQVEQLRSMADHDRIARDLHDTVIQRLFAIAMRLESAVSGPTGVANERMGEAVDALDDVIREIRSTIFDLRRPHDAERGLRAVVATEIDRVADLLGFAPSLRIVGPIDASVTEDAAREAAAVVRELLSNVVRHADASSVDVTIRTDEHSMSVIVEDDGVGMDDESGVGNGLPNLITRARALGGSFAIAPTAPHGVRAEWAVPLGADG